MAANANLVKHGTAGGVAIKVDLARLETGFTKKVLLTSAYTIVSDPGIPTRPSFTGAQTKFLEFPRTIPAGTALTLHPGEADALVAAGKATYA